MFVGSSFVPTSPRRQWSEAEDFATSDIRRRYNISTLRPNKRSTMRMSSVYVSTEGANNKRLEEIA
jgi:hypothetical protein